MTAAAGLWIIAYYGGRAARWLAATGTVLALCLLSPGCLFCDSVEQSGVGLEEVFVEVLAGYLTGSEDELAPQPAAGVRVSGEH